MKCNLDLINMDVVDNKENLKLKKFIKLMNSQIDKMIKMLR